MCPPTAAIAPTLRGTSFKVKTSPVMILPGIGILFIKGWSCYNDDVDTVGVENLANQLSSSSVA